MKRQYVDKVPMIPNVASPAQLWNVLGATVQTANLEVGTLGFSLSDLTLYACTDATLGAAKWEARTVSSTLYNELLANIAANDPLSTFPSYGTISTIVGGCDFLTTANGLSPFNTTQSGAGAGVTQNVTTGGRLGVVTFETGTTATGYCSIYTAPNSILLGNGELRIRMGLLQSTASNGTDRYSSKLGMLDTNTGIDATDGVYFRYTDTENAGNWTGVCRSNGVETTANSGVSGISASYVVLEIVVNAAATSAKFYINGALVGTIVSNIPSGAGRETGFVAQILKSLGTNDRFFYLDTFRWRLALTTPL